MQVAELQDVRNWAHDKAWGGQEPPWAWYQYMKLIETLDAILAGMASIAPPVSQSTEAPPTGGLRLVAHNGSSDIEHAPPAHGLTGPMPM
jgi:hypothetical protein